MASDVLITSLPNELLEHIMEEGKLGIRETLNFGLTCKHLYRLVICSNRLWKTKFFQRWPDLKQYYKEELAAGNKDLLQVNWYEESRASYSSIKEMMGLLSSMSAKNQSHQELSSEHMSEFDRFVLPFSSTAAPDAAEKQKHATHIMAFSVVVNELARLITLPAWQSNLTHKYYAQKVVRHLRQKKLEIEWKKKFCSENTEENMTLEKGAILVSQWSQPEIEVSHEKVSAALDDIARQAMDYLSSRQHQYLSSSKRHPLLEASAEDLELFKSKNLSDNQWSPAECREALDALSHVLFNKLFFQTNNDSYYTSENAFIDRVLERKSGAPIILIVIVESVARRLGVKCEPISLPAHFLLRWREKYNDDKHQGESYYVDIFDGGRLITKKDCPRVGGSDLRCPLEVNNRSVHKAATVVQVVERMAGSLEMAGRQRTHLNGRAARLRSALELLHMVRPHDTNVILHLARFYILHQMDPTKIMAVLTELLNNPVMMPHHGPANQILQMLTDYSQHIPSHQQQDHQKVKKRTSQIKYAVGLIMLHRRYNYFCVITGWDESCKASAQWLNDMNVDELAGGRNQPFYNVFVDDGSMRYAAQENLLMAATPGWINHEEVGRYFCKFNETHYIPNEEKAKEYPEDALVRDELVRQTYHSCQYEVEFRN